MTDEEKREKVKDVINAFERVVEVFDGRISGPYFEAWMCATKDALALLKAQEPVEPTEPDEENTKYCGVCGSGVGYEVIEPSGLDYVRYNYCPNCGRAVKW